MDPKSLTFVLVSYVPLVNVQGGACLTNPEDVQSVARHVDSLPLHTARGALWGLQGDMLSVGLFVERAQEIAEHLKWWSEGEPEKWFRLHWLKRQGKYALALMPDLQKSVERHRIGFQLQTGFPPPENADYRIYFKPLCFGSGSTTGFDGARKYFGSKCVVGLIDTGFADLPMEQAASHAIPLGTFDFVEGGAAKGYLKDIIEEM